MKVVITEKENENELIIGGVTYITIDAQSKKNTCEGCVFKDYIPQCRFILGELEICYFDDRKDKRDIIWKLKKEKK